jgi:tetratricopeptide (TPR) repeat protein
VAASYVARQETGLSFASLPTGTTLLVPAKDTAEGLDGLGGTGKTCVAATLAYECHDIQAAQLVLWVTATGRDEETPSIAQALRDSTKKLHDIAGAFLLSAECHPAMLHAGRSLDDSGLTGPAVAYWGAMASATQQALGAGHPQTVAVRDLLGAACQASGRHDEAVAIYEGVLADRERALGAGHPDTVAARDRLAQTYIAAGRPNDAIGTAERALTSVEAAAGPNHQDTLTAHTNLASAYLGAGRHDDAIAALRRVLARMESVLGWRGPGSG